MKALPAIALAGCPEAKTNDESMSCIETREKMGKKKPGLSHE